ncbi:MAG: PHP domain-containing protein [Anaeromicrobium sp.]|jgi:predicted metal-dependent phosphoesterase TrpH|uniref:PHP domain-containing protein n=1 Tax=Anaeromicrobium sp. TaxID=1929132 RepID=UPI0025F9491F|nr:PHP domain-containing protein [Anaeromicrobium sp.]MCT4595011.1 PHP domain-containing protein [Anaeromicrobium sp.]
MEKIDMHVHTTASDGIFTPKEIIEWALKLNLAGIAITDHDTVEGIKEAIETLKDNTDFLLIPGIEFSCLHEGSEVHILGYFIDYENEELNKICRNIKEARKSRALKIIEKLRNKGMDITKDDLVKIGHVESIGRPHIARIMVAKGYVKDMEEAFTKWIGRNRPAYVERYKISIKEAVYYIRKAGGVAVLAHPGLLEEHIDVLDIINLGIDGIEVYHTKHTKEKCEQFEKMAKENDKLVTGGTDFHEPVYACEPHLGKIHIKKQEIEKMLRKL